MLSSRSFLSRNTPSHHRPLIAQTVPLLGSAQRRMFALTPRSSSQPQTFAHQSSLKKLPVPDLNASLERYVKSLTPILKDRNARGVGADGKGKGAVDVQAELDKRRKWAEDFASEGGLGRTLQERLKDVDRAAPDNWLDDTWWIKAAYHSWRVPLPINSNWWILFAHDQDISPDVVNLDKAPPKGQFTEPQIRRAANVTWRLVDFKVRLDKQDILPDSSRAGPFCMHQYSRVFGVTRLPTLPTDSLVHAPHPHPARYIVVMARDQFYRVDVIDPSGEPKSRQEIEALLWAVAENVSSLSDGEKDAPVGVLTGDTRDNWTKAREHLLQVDPVNRKTLETIEDSLFVVSLDDWVQTHPSPTKTTPYTSEPAPFGQTSRDLDSHILNSSTGLRGHNRWFDKTVSIHFESNSRGGMMGEHSPCDALIPSIVADYALAEGVGKDEGKSQKGAAVPGGALERIRFTSDEGVKKDIERAEKTVGDLVEDSEGLQLWFNDYGADWIKKGARQSPDAYLQMALQLGWYKMHGWATATYETASTRVFRHGRTDVIRTLSDDSWTFVNAMVNKEGDDAHRYKLLTAACTAHNSYTRDSSLGKGCDRHLMGLRLLLSQGESHPLLEDELFSESQTWHLSTSGLSAGDRFFGTGFGTVWTTGYGINYLAGSKIIKFGIESKRSDPNTSTEKFRQKVTEALREMREICEKGAPTVEPAKTKL